jgi:hypothetical protein
MEKADGESSKVSRQFDFKVVGFVWLNYIDMKPTVLAGKK